MPHESTQSCLATRVPSERRGNFEPALPLLRANEIPGNLSGNALKMCVAAQLGNRVLPAGARRFGLILDFPLSKRAGPDILGQWYEDCKSSRVISQWRGHEFRAGSSQVEGYGSGDPESSGQRPATTESGGVV
jgi:hypothetical protein